MKKKSSFILIAILVLSIFSQSVFAYEIESVDMTPNKDFVADSPSDWAVDSIKKAAELGIAPLEFQMGYTQTVTRKEFCEIAIVLYEKLTGEVKEYAIFDDTNNVAVQKLAAVKVVSGIGNNKFAPDALLTREQAAVLLTNLCKALKKPLANNATTFSDKNIMSSWAIDGVGSVQATNIMTGVGNNTFSPTGNYTREQSIMTMLKVFNYYNK